MQLLKYHFYCRDSQTGVILHLAPPQGKALLASGGWRPAKLLSSLECSVSLHSTNSKELPGPNDNSAQAEKPSSTGLYINYITAIRRSTSDEDLLLEKERLRV